MGICSHISQDFVTEGAINNMPALVWVMNGLVSMLTKGLCAMWCLQVTVSWFPYEANAWQYCYVFVLLFVWFEDLCARSNSQGHGEVITVSVDCNYWSLPDKQVLNDESTVICQYLRPFMHCWHNQNWLVPLSAHVDEFSFEIYLVIQANALSNVACKSWANFIHKWWW